MNNLTKAIIIVGVGGIGYAVYRYFKPRRTDSQQEEDIVSQGGGGSGAGGGNGVQTKLTQTYANAMYNVLAEQIWGAAHANNWSGTQEDAIYDVFKQMKNDIDISKLISAFGARRMYLSFSNGALKEWINAEMDDSEIAKINSILQSNNISYRF
jgi:hypothetical protein